MTVLLCKRANKYDFFKAGLYQPLAHTGICPFSDKRKSQNYRSVHVKSLHVHYSRSCYLSSFFFKPNGDPSSALTMLN